MPSKFEYSMVKGAWIQFKTIKKWQIVWICSKSFLIRISVNPTENSYPSQWGRGERVLTFESKSSIEESLVSPSFQDTIATTARRPRGSDGGDDLRSRGEWEKSKGAWARSGCVGCLGLPEGNDPTEAVPTRPLTTVCPAQSPLLRGA